MTIDGAMRRLRPSALIVEDDDLTAHLLQLLLRTEGYAVSRAATGLAAKAYISRSRPLELVTLDGRLPDTSGAEVLEFIRAMPGWEDVPVLMVTGASLDERDLSRALQWNDVTYLAKPFTPPDLTEVVQRLSARNAFTSFRGNPAAARAATQGEHPWHR
jgi:DNA-binding response OmpR family regulator